MGVDKEHLSTCPAAEDTKAGFSTLEPPALFLLPPDEFWSVLPESDTTGDLHNRESDSSSV